MKTSMQDGVVTWREVVERHHGALVDDLTLRLDSEIQKAVAHAVRKEQERAVTQIERARRTTAESLNQTMRLIRQSAAEAPALQLLADGSAPYAQRAVVLLIENNHAKSLSTRGVTDDIAFTFALEDAPAIGSAVESKDPVVALASDREISAPLAAALGVSESQSDPDGKAYLFPVVVRQKVVAMLVAAGDVVPAPLELICEAAGMKFELLAPETPSSPETPKTLEPLPNPELVQISAPSVPATATSERRAWDDLTPEDQKLHLQAQRVARVRVAEMRLYHAEDLSKGVFAGNIYTALASPIDAARTEFLQTFLSKSPTMVDYLHLEILRSLAHDDDRLLGQEYPGPMV
jgi:hypothetical protein